MMSRWHVAVLFSLVVGSGSAAGETGELRHSLEIFLAADIRVSPEPGGHGVLFADYRLDGLLHDGQLHARFNTDTLQLGVEDIALDGPDLRLGFYAQGEAIFAGLLPDYYQRGLLVAARGFHAGYLLANLHLKKAIASQHFLTSELALRRWFFARQDDTATALQLPEETWVFEPALRYTLWLLERDPSLEESHRPSLRIRGLALGADLEMMVRGDASPWGAQEDPRNRPAPVGLALRQWLRAGHQLLPWARLQLTQQAGFGFGLDDLYRTRVGGMNPYVVPVAGLPWAALLASNYVALQLSAHFKVWQELEVGPWVDGVVLEDIERRGRDDLDWTGAAGAFADWQLGSWQFDLRAGWTLPQAWQVAGPHLSVYFLVGKKLL